MKPSVSNEDLLAEWELVAPPKSAEYPLGQALLSAKSFIGYRTDVRAFARDLEGMHPGMHFTQVDTSVCDQWLAAQLGRPNMRNPAKPVSPRSIVRAAFSVQGFYEWLRLRKRLLVDGNPWDVAIASFRQAHETPSEADMRALAVDELNDLLVVASPRDFVGMFTATKCFLRGTESLAIRDDDVFVKERFITLKRLVRGKRHGPNLHRVESLAIRNKVAGNRYFPYPIDDELAEVLEWWYSGPKQAYGSHPYLIPRAWAVRKLSDEEPYSLRAWNQSIQETVMRSSVVVRDWSDPNERISSHTFRRTGNSEWVRNNGGEEPLYLRAMRGDKLGSVLGSAEPYVKFREGALREAYGRSMPRLLRADARSRVLG